MVSLDLGANVGRSGTLGAWLSRKTDLVPGIQPIEIDRAAAVEEVVVAVFGGDKPESALGDELLDGSRHIVDLLSRTYCLALSRPVRAGPGERTHFECCHTFTHRQPPPNINL